MKSNWIIHKRKYEDIIRQLLSNRGVDLKYKEQYLSPDFERDLLNSEKLPDFKIFADRIVAAKKNKEIIGIFADYDADGIPGAALFSRALHEIGIKHNVYIPTREEGYGLSQKGIDELINQGCSLIITIDLGIRSQVEADYCTSRKIDLIITDHHLPGEKVPRAIAVINPKLPKSKYAFRELCGAGLLFKLICGLSKYFPKEINERFLKWNIDLAAISTISDVVPLNGENRIIAKYGLLVINKTKNIGLSKLIEITELNKRPIGAYEVGFMIGPRLNAPGRIKDASKSFDLLTTTDAKKATLLARDLDSENRIRQQLMEELITEATKTIEKGKLNQNKIIVLSGKWSKGIIGPSASQIADKYHRPVIIFSTSQKIYTGSARSFNNLDIFSLIQKVSKYLSRFGGHRGAAGLSLKADKFPQFSRDIIKISDKLIKDSDLIKKYKIDIEINFSQLDFVLLEKINQFEPFGLGNPRPVFLSRGVAIYQPKVVGRGANHLSMFLEHSNKRIKSIYFSHPQEVSDLKHGSSADILYNLSIDNWNGNRYININIIDMDIELQN